MNFIKQYKTQFFVILPILLITFFGIIYLNNRNKSMLGGTYVNPQTNIPTNLTVSSFATSTISQWVNNAGYVTSTLPLSVNQTYSGVTIVLQPGEDLVAGDVVYIKSDGKVWKADANAVTTTPAMGIAVANIASTTTGVILLHGLYVGSVNYGIGAVLYVSTEAGKATSTQPSATNDLIQSIGIGYGQTIYFSPDLIFLNHS